MKHVLLAVLVACAPALAPAQGAPAPDGASLCFIGLEDGATVTSPLTVRFGLTDISVAPSGMENEAPGHRHLLIDRPPFGEGEFGSEELKLAVPNDDYRRHFGGGQTETAIGLTPGSHTLQLVLGDMGHVPHDPPATSAAITVTVE